MELPMDFRSELKRRLIVFDGAMGTMIQRYGLSPGQPPETFNIPHPDVVEGIHRQYIEAGADVITTNTFGANEFKLKGTGYTVEQVITRTAVLARRAAGNKWVALDMGPIGQLMEPMGWLSFEQAYELYARQVKAGVQGGLTSLVMALTCGLDAPVVDLENARIVETIKAFRILNGDKGIGYMRF